MLLYLPPSKETIGTIDGWLPNQGEHMVVDKGTHILLSVFLSCRECRVRDSNG